MIPILRFDPRQAGARCWLGPLELRIMAFVWRERAATARQVGQLADRRHAKTTVITTMERLVAKGLLRKGAGAVYEPTMTEAAFIVCQRAYVVRAIDAASDRENPGDIGTDEPGRGGRVLTRLRPSWEPWRAFSQA